MDMDLLEALEYVAVIAEEGSYERASQRLHKPKSSLSRKIRGVEQNYRVKFFDGPTRQSELTAEGQMGVAGIKPICQQAERLQESIQYCGRVATGPIRIGFSPYSSKTSVRRLHELKIADFETQLVRPEGLPEPLLEVEVGSTPNLIERVLRGKLHAALGVLPIDDNALWVELLLRERFCVCLPKGHPLAHRQTIAARELNRQTVFLIPHDMHPAFYDRTVEYIRSTGAHPIYQEIPQVPHATEIAEHGPRHQPAARCSLQTMAPCIQ
jgi:LysR family transcriptional regulator, benzoate and cis,cis-muconate-responsive activator of ben and cat genes